MALRDLITSPKTPYFQPPPLRLFIICMVDRVRVLQWSFEGNTPRPPRSHKFKRVAITDGLTVATLTVWEDGDNDIQEGGSYVLRGHSLRGTSPPYKINVGRKGEFFSCAPISVPDEVLQLGRGLLTPKSPKTPFTDCTEDTLVSVEGEVVKQSPVQQIIRRGAPVPMRKLTIKEGDLQQELRLWGTAALEVQEIGEIRVFSHMVGKSSDLGFQLHSTQFTSIAESNRLDSIVIIGTKKDKTREGTMRLLLEGQKEVFVSEALWTSVKHRFTEESLVITARVVGNVVEEVFEE